RLRPRIALELGPVLHPDDLAADKMLALWGRARPRDFYDVHALMRHFTRE
ncbi:MAG: nucleotidyl transferase AbiEii/AbiGii toxin family protein, partial [Pseudonocardia sp.]|nr:nucleotidyl transferase AbiEii/AbiGii toxin family protein [Pseudonocardia sp.]